MFFMYDVHIASMGRKIGTEEKVFAPAVLLCWRIDTQIGGPADTYSKYHGLLGTIRQ